MKNRERPLNGRRAKFAQLYTTGPDKMRGNAAACYRAAGYHPKTEHAAAVGGSRLLNNDDIRDLILGIEAESRAQLIHTLRDWKELAPDAQRRIRVIMMGFLPDPLSTPDQPRLRPLSGKDACTEAMVILRAAEFIINRAYPKNIYMTAVIPDPAATLAALLGVRVEDLPTPESIEAIALHPDENGTYASS